LLAAASAPPPTNAQVTTEAYAPGRVLVRFAPGTASAVRAELRRSVSAQGTRALGLVPGLEVIRTGLDVPQAIAVLGNNPNVVYAEPDYVVAAIEIPDDEFFNLEWGLDNHGQDIRGVPGIAGADIDMPEAWDTLPGSDTIVAVIDTGTQWDHEDLAANVWVNADENADGTDTDGNGFVDDVRGWDFFSNDNDPDDAAGHGTHTAGTIGAVRNNGLGIAGICGQCRIMPLRFIGPNGGYTSDAIDALGYAVANGATVSNNSWGGGPWSQALYNAIAAAGAAGHVFVAAAGNNALNADVAPMYPAAYDLPNVISVAATDNTDRLAAFSNFGVVSVDIAAPGVDIASTYPDPSTAGDDYWWNSGTSMAAPHVAGVVALLQHQDPSLSAEQLVDIVLRSARPVQNLGGLVATGGVLNASNALNRVYPEPLPPPPPPPPEPATPTDLAATDGGQGTAILTWTAVEHATYYLLEREERRNNGRRIGGTWFEIPAGAAAGAAEPFEDAAGASDNLYYRIAAGNDSGNSVMSDWIHVAVTDGSGDGGTDGGDGGSGSGRCHPKKGCP
jgi:subtilisin family serine protease